MSRWARIHLRSTADGAQLEQAPEKWVTYTDHGVRVDWPEAGHTLIPWPNVLRIDHQATPTKEDTP